MKKIAIISAVCALSAALIAAACLFTGALWFNMPSREEFPVWGVDVSLMQGEIDWQAMSAEDIGFAYIEATAGGSHTDERFAENWRGARNAGLLTGAYHILDDEQSGTEQAEHFITTVPWSDKMLPPVVVLDVDEHSQSAPQILSDMVDALEEHYGVMPILHVSHDMFETFVQGRYEDCPIWIRDIFSMPGELADGRDWLMWQYSSSGWIPAYSGGDWNIDLNVFAGSWRELREMEIAPRAPLR